MSRAGRLEAEGLIRMVRSDRLCQVELANGHRLWAWVPRRGSVEKVGQVGDRVCVEVSVCDLTRGKIVKIQRKDS